jgi:hypothetical protein
LIVSTSAILFVFDRGNIISYASEKINGWQDPSFKEMVEFICDDKTDLNSYIPGLYECKNFVIDFIKNARDKDFRAGYVSLHNTVGDDHAICCFKTKDRGLYFVEPQLDYFISLLEMERMVSDGRYYFGKYLGVDDCLEMPISGYQISWYMVI